MAVKFAPKCTFFCLRINILLRFVASYPRPSLLDEGAKEAPPEVTTEGGVRVIRVRTHHYRAANYLMRGLGELLLPYLFLSKVKSYVSKGVDAVVVYTPPLALTIAGRIVKRFLRTKFILNVQDIFPQNAIDLGILRNPVLAWLLKRLERQAYRGADRITAHSNNNAKYLIENRGVPASRVTSIYNWIDLSPYRNKKATGIFRTRYGLEGKFVFLFAGILGPSQGLDFIIRIAEEVQSIGDIQFLMIGDGREKRGLVKMVRERGLDNVRFHPFVSVEDYPGLVKDVDVGLASLSSKNTTPVFPGKIVGFMASAVPILAFLNRESDGHQIIREARCGYSTVSDDHKKAADLVRKVFQERETLPLLGRNGFEYARTHFSKETCIDMMEKVIKSA